MASDNGRVGAVRFKDGAQVPADLVVMAVGIRPNTALAESMRLHCNRGIVVTDTMQTITDARIYAVGECAAHRGIAYGLVAPLFEQAKVAANHLANFGIGRYTGSLTSTKLKVAGIDLFSAGNFTGGEGCEDIVTGESPTPTGATSDKRLSDAKAGLQPQPAPSVSLFDRKAEAAAQFAKAGGLRENLGRIMESLGPMPARGQDRARLEHLAAVSEIGKALADQTRGGDRSILSWSADLGLQASSLGLVPEQLSALTHGFTQELMPKERYFGSDSFSGNINFGRFLGNDPKNPKLSALNWGYSLARNQVESPFEEIDKRNQGTPPPG